MCLFPVSEYSCLLLSQWTNIPPEVSAGCLGILMWTGKGCFINISIKVECANQVYSLTAVNRYIIQITHVILNIISFAHFANFSCCSLIASASAAASWLCPLVITHVQNKVMSHVVSISNIWRDCTIAHQAMWQRQCWRTAANLIVLPVSSCVQLPFKHIL